MTIPGLIPLEAVITGVVGRNGSFFQSKLEQHQSRQGLYRIPFYSQKVHGSNTAFQSCLVRVGANLLGALDLAGSCSYF